MPYDFSRVLVQEMIASPHATKYYMLARQRKPIGHMSLVGVSNLTTFMMAWRESVGRDGSFALQAYNTNGKFGKCLGIIEVHGQTVTIKDKRCSLSAMFKSRQEAAKREKQFDFALSGGYHKK